MIRNIIYFLFFSTATFCYSQEEQFQLDTLRIQKDSLYREDQFYAGINYNSIITKPAGVSQEKISFGFSAGFLRDFPLNKKRTFAIAPGIGFSFNNYIQNMAITGSGSNPIYSVIPSTISYNKNRFEQWRVELPIELRWRDSSPSEFSFFRIYSGFKVSYLLSDKSVFDTYTQNTIIKNNKDFEEFLYGVYLSIGYSAFNVQVYYGLNTLFKPSAQINSGPITMDVLSLGVVFYIL